MKEKDYTYYSQIVEQAIADHKSGKKKIMTQVRANSRKIPQELVIHKDEVFTQCYIPLDQEEPDRKHIRSQLRRRYFISEKYCQLIAVNDDNEVYWVKEELTGGDNRPRFKAMQDKKKTTSDPTGDLNRFKNGINTYTLYGLVFGCYITERAKRRIRKNLYQAIGDYKGCVQTHHITPYHETYEPEENGHIYDVAEMEILTYEEHQLLDKNPNNPTIPKGDSEKEKFECFIEKADERLSGEENTGDYLLTVIRKSGREQELISVPLNLFITINSTIDNIENDIALYKSFVEQAGDNLVDAINKNTKGTGYLKVDIADKLSIDIQKRGHDKLEKGFFATHTPYEQYLDNGKDPNKCIVEFMYCTV